ncbi:glycosyltransferase [Fibrivirga algicola]|uniref:glycosyltransferase n=1 Tax=Fibrivirga algicola TaxID=2950420 RepID=UPI000A18BB80|nr:glycosyltransferase [Fibrivirga algicola]
MSSTLPTPLRINIVIPVFNDWEALLLLLQKIRETVAPALYDRFAFLIVDDCSATDLPRMPEPVGQSLSILRLYRNVGHQKAIALGISYLADQPIQYPTVVMDGDGDDLPTDIARLLETSEQQPGRIVFAHRSKRHENLLFRVFYAIYKSIFRSLTGKVITFGNFSLVPPQLVRKLAYVSEIWNNYPGGIIRSRLPYTAIPIERGTRLAGQSKMNFVSLVLHGLSAVSVLMDTTAVRIALFCVLTAGVSMVGIGIVTYVRFFTQTTVPGWAIYLVFSFFIVILQAFLISLLLIFIVLTYRTQQHFLPAKQYRDFIERVDAIYTVDTPAPIH